VAFQKVRRRLGGTSEERSFSPLSRLCGSEVDYLEAELGRRLLACPQKGKGGMDEMGI